MQVFAAMSERMGPVEAGAHARRVEAMGYDGLLVPEAVHDGLLVAMAALSATRRIRVATSVLVAFPRSPMTTAVAAWDLQASSAGRFELGLGTQVRGNLVGRFSTPWLPPVARMRDYVASLRAIFHSFQTGEPLDHAGEFYRFDRLQPFFNPGPLDCGAPPIQLAAVGPDMTRLAGEIADGLMTHPTNSAPDYLAEVVRPRVEEGAARASRSPDDCPITAAGFVATGADDEAVARSRDEIRRQFAFLFSTPAYWKSIEHAGFSDLGSDLRALAKLGRWNEMEARVPHELIERLVPSGRYDEIARVLIDHYCGQIPRITFPLPDDPARDTEVAALITSLRAT